MSTPVARGLAVHDQLTRLVRPAELAVTARGDRLAVVRWHDGNADVVVLDVDGGTGRTDPSVVSAAREVVLDPSPHAVGLPRWSADGTTLWLAAAYGDELDTLVCVDGETSRTVATFAGAVEDLWPLDDGRVVVRVADPGADRDGMHLGLPVAGADDPTVRAAGRGLRRLVVVAPDETVTTLDLDGWTVWDVHALGGTAVAVASHEVRPAGYYRSTLIAIDLDTGTVETVYEPRGQLARPRISPDGTTVQVVEGRSIVSGVVHRISLSDHARQTVRDLDDVTDHGWTADGSGWFVGWSGTGVHGGLLGDNGRGSHRWHDQAHLTGAEAQPALAVPTAPGNSVAYALRDAAGQPPEVVSYALATGARTVLTSWNADHQIAPSRQRTITWTSADGTPVEGVLLLPAEPADGPYPLVLLLHGGPTWLWSEAFSPEESNELALSLVAAGSAVLLPNPRGSSGRGQGWARAVVDDFGGIDRTDVLAGVDALVADRTADPTRLAVAGLSYGGYLTAWLAATTDRFHAAVVLSGVSDWQSFGTSSAIACADGGYDRTYQPSSDWRTPYGRTRLAERSPVYHLHADVPPTLIVHGAADRVTPLGQAEQLHGGLRSWGVRSELVVWPGAGHELTDPVQRRETVRRALAWLTDNGVLR